MFSSSVHESLDAHPSQNRMVRAGRVGIFSGNTVPWMLAMQACNYYSLAVGAPASCHCKEHSYVPA